MVHQLSFQISTKHFSLSSMFLSYFLLYWGRIRQKGEHYGIKKKRSEFPENELWDLPALPRPGDFLRAIENTWRNQWIYPVTKGQPPHFRENEAGTGKSTSQLNHIGNYGFMPQTTDFGDEALRKCPSEDGFELEASVRTFLLWWCFGRSGWKDVSNAWDSTTHLTKPFARLKLKSSLLGELMKKTLTNLGEVFYGPEHLCQDAGTGFTNGWFWSGWKSLQNSFVTYESYHQNHENAEIREKITRSFSEKVFTSIKTLLLLPLSSPSQVWKTNRRYERLAPCLTISWLSGKWIHVWSSDWPNHEGLRSVAQKFLKHVAKVNGLENDLCRLEVGLGQCTQPDVTIDDASEAARKTNPGTHLP